MMAPTIRAVAFDFSGVMTMNPLGGLATLEEELGCAPGTLTAEFRGGDLFCECEVGRLPLAEFFTRWRAKLSEQHGREFDLEPILAVFRRAGAMNPETMDLIARLDPSVRLAILTNNVPEVRSGWQRKIPIERFAVVIDSSEVGLRKPDPAIYDLLLERLQLSGDAVAYVDDYEANLAPAAALGMRTIHFTTAPACEQALAALGVRFTSPPWETTSPPHSAFGRSLPKGERRRRDRR
ncbi:MAG: HAD family hydrolase [Candidatus Binatia bacterium]